MPTATSAAPGPYHSDEGNGYVPPSTQRTQAIVTPFRFAISTVPIVGQIWPRRGG